MNFAIIVFDGGIHVPILLLPSSPLPLISAATLWAVVNNAGIALHCELEWCSAEDMSRILEVNSVGPFRVAKALLPALRRSPP